LQSNQVTTQKNPNNNDTENYIQTHKMKDKAFQGEETTDDE